MNQARSDDLASELAYVRSLAEEGATAPLVSGFYYLLWGGLMGAAALLVYAVAIGFIPAGTIGYFAPWMVAGLIGWAGSLAWGRKSKIKPGALTLGNQTANSVWFAVGVFMTILWIAFMIVHDNYTQFGVPENFLFTLMFPIAFGVYGVAFYATATAAKLPWLRWFACLAWGFSMLSLFLLGDDLQFLLGGTGCILTAALPGALLMRREPGDIV
ncbi:hypothetical protein [Hyphococcus sp.]|uniref:hypothetical protein n=1 Tax=Hyphococcus sp. TaxID=2038636 RepID=UPI003CCBC4F4